MKRPRFQVGDRVRATKTLSLHVQPDPGEKTVASLARGQEATIAFREPVMGKWMLRLDNGTEGWAFASFKPADEPEPPPITNWQDAWEWHAKQTAEAFDDLSEEALLHRIQARRYDGYYQIWYVLAEKGTLKTSGPVLLAVLRHEAGEAHDLLRYHCAAALFHLLGYPREPMPDLRKRVQWAHHGEDARQQALDELEALIHEHL